MRRVSCKENEPLDYVRTELDNWISRGEDFLHRLPACNYMKKRAFSQVADTATAKVLQEIYNQSNCYYGV